MSCRPFENGWTPGRFEPDAFRCTTDKESVTCRIEFKFENEAKACADTFGGQLTPTGNEPSG